MFHKIITTFLVAAIIAIGASGAAREFEGGGESDFSISDNAPYAKTAKELKTIGAPTRGRAKIIATAGTVVGTAVGEVATTAVSCISRCFGVDTGYRFGDMTKKAIKGIKKMWGLDSSSSRSERKSFVDPYPRHVPGGDGNGLGTARGYQAMMDR